MNILHSEKIYETIFNTLTSARVQKKCSWKYMWVAFLFTLINKGMWSNHKNRRHGQVYCNRKHWKQEEEEVVCSFLFTCKSHFPNVPQGCRQTIGNTFFLLSVCVRRQTKQEGKLTSKAGLSQDTEEWRKTFWGIQVPMSTVACIIRERKKFHHVKQNSVV